MEQKRYQRERRLTLPLWIWPVVLSRIGVRRSRRAVTRQFRFLLLLGLFLIPLAAITQQRILIVATIITAVSIAWHWLGIRWLNRHQAWARGPHSPDPLIG